jgi:hypothetical protein
VTSSTAIVNAALEMINGQVQISGTNPTFDGTVAGNAAGVLYTPTVQLLLRELDPDFARRIAPLTTQAGETLLLYSSFTQEFAYPSDCLRLRQVAPLRGSYDVNDPQPIRAQVAFDPLNAGGPTKVILCNLAQANAAYTTANVTETQFDAGFVETLTRRLASPLAMALAGRPDFARELLEESERYAALANENEDLQ